MSAPVILLLAIVSTSTTQAAVCDPSCTRLASFEIWRRQTGYWIGNYTLLGPDGKPFNIEAFPYHYQNYFGFVRTVVKGPCFLQRSVFVYPPLDPKLCTSPTFSAGNGVCGVNGNEKAFFANAVAADCEGNLVGQDEQGVQMFESKVTANLGNDDVEVFTVRGAKGTPFEGFVFENVLTTAGSDGFRVRAVQSIVPGTATAKAVGMQLERRVTKEEWEARLEQVRKEFNVLPEDYCGWNFLNVRTGKSCKEHFALPECPVRVDAGRCKKSRKRYRMCVAMKGVCKCTA